jgi:hypothetical protein
MNDAMNAAITYLSGLKICIVQLYIIFRIIKIKKPLPYLYSRGLPIPPDIILDTARSLVLRMPYRDKSGADHLFLLADPPDRLRKAFQDIRHPQRLDQVGAGAFFDRSDAPFHGGTAGDHYHFGPGIEFPDIIQEFNAVHTGHNDIAVDYVDYGLFDYRQAIHPVCRGKNRIPFALKDILKPFPDVSFIVDDQYLHFSHSPPRSFLNAYNFIIKHIHLSGGIQGDPGGFMKTVS